MSCRIKMAIDLSSDIGRKIYDKHTMFIQSHIEFGSLIFLGEEEIKQLESQRNQEVNRSLNLGISIAHRFDTLITPYGDLRVVRSRIQSTIKIL